MTDRRSVFSLPLVRELAVVLVIKLALIFAIKTVFFSDPVDMSDPQDAITQQFGLKTNPSHTPKAEDLQ